MYFSQSKATVYPNRTEHKQTNVYTFKRYKNCLLVLDFQILYSDGVCRKHVQYIDCLSNPLGLKDQPKYRYTSTPLNAFCHSFSDQLYFS